MSSASKNLSDYNSKNIPNGKDFKIGIVVADWNEEITHALYEACKETLIKHEVPQEQIISLHVPGAYELPQGVRILLQKESKIDAIIAIGCVIKGETSHNDYINQAVSTGLMQLGLTSGKPCIFGVLTPNDLQQAKDRSGGKHGNKGVEAAITALQMADLSKKHKVIGSCRIGFGS